MMDNKESLKSLSKMQWGHAFSWRRVGLEIHKSQRRLFENLHCLQYVCRVWKDLLKRYCDYINAEIVCNEKAKAKIVEEARLEYEKAKDVLKEV